MSEFENELEKLKNDPEFLTEKLLIHLTEQICKVMVDKGITRSGLARKIGVPRQYITRVLNGYPNLTLLTLTRIAVALETELSVSMQNINQ